MNRRTLLTAIGSILVAGCSQSRSGRSGKEAGAYRDGFGMGRNADTPVEFGFQDNNKSFDFEYDDDVEFGFNSSRVGPDVTFDFGGKQNTKDDSLPTPAETDERATDYIVRSRDLFIEAINTYAGFGGEDIDITSVSPATESFSQYPIKSKIDNTKQLLRRGAKYATEGQKPYILALEQTGIFLKHATEAEVELRAALSEYQTSIGFLYDADTTNFDSPRKRLRDHTDEAREEIDLIRSETDSSALQVIDSDAQELYKAKLAQFDTLIQAFRSLDQGIVQVGDGMSDLKEGVELYIDRKYDDASFRCGSASTSFSSGKRRFEQAHSDDILRSEIQPGLDFATVLYQLTSDLSRSAEAMTNDNSDKYVKFREKAVAHLQSNDKTEHMREINQIQW
jgi:hypothetical protein